MKLYSVAFIVFKVSSFDSVLGTTWAKAHSKEVALEAVTFKLKQEYSVEKGFRDLKVVINEVPRDICCNCGKS